MTAFANDDVRRLIPRWRFYRNNSPSAEFSGDPRKPNMFAPDLRFLKEKIDDWETHPSIATAADTVACAITTGNFSQAEQCAQFLLEHESRITKHVKWLAEYALRSSEQPRTGTELQLKLPTEALAIAAAHGARARLRQNPRNLLAQLDLSLAYTNLGQKQHAILAMENALRLDPFHRYALRAAARLFVHTDDAERAHLLLARCKRTPTDPWLMAAEISVAAISERSPRHIKNARSLIAARKLPTIHLSELYSAIGTADFWDGKLKLARKNLRNSLTDPTDNVVAQARWIKAQKVNLEISQDAWNVPCTFEARCWRALQEQRWQEAVDECRNWLCDEPFSSRPAKLGSFIGLGLVEDYPFAESCARVGLKVDPSEQILLNNLTVVLAYQNKLVEAKGVFERIKQPLSETHPSYVHSATEGLLHFRSGNVVLGRSLYEKAEAIAPTERKTSVIIHRASEEQFARTELASEMLKRAKEKVAKSKDPYIRRLYEQLISKRLDDN